MSNSPEYTFSESDLEVLKESSIPVTEAKRQLKLLAQPTYFARLDRACTVGDGINLIDDAGHKTLINLHEKARKEGRFIKFVPASGAASRMFRDLMYFLEHPPYPRRNELDDLAKSGSAEAKSVIKFLANINHFAFHDKLQEQFTADLNSLKNQDSYIDILKKLLTSEGLNYASLPKGVLPFHCYDNDVKTSFEEHLTEAAYTIKDKYNLCRLHFTVSEEHLSKFHSLYSECRSKTEQALGISLDVTFSVQKKSTDMLSLDSNKQPFHDENGRIMLRPGGHGALIENLNDLKADLVFIKNIDNVQHDTFKSSSLLYKKVLSGLLLQIQEKVFESLRKLENTVIQNAELEEILHFADTHLNMPVDQNKWNEANSPSEKAILLFEILNRPIRVCGMVRNTGEPGGGPFWVRGSDGNTSMQIVEGAQINLKDPAQNSVFNSATHFNPVDIVCSLRNYKNEQFCLHDYINHEAVIKTCKSYKGRDLVTCERPGLWNGAMAGWITIFVDVPESTFSPVKTVLDFLRK